ncbi:MAG TPA: flagellar hook-length control protein FliK, partial [Syntrophales bacterium]|nr:flagellar hook-length control protein FliK [Syntrophales bacterium]
GIEDDGIGEILSEIKDKGLFTAKEGRKQVLPPVNSISEYDAEALGGERATNAVYETPEAGMKPWRREEQASIIRIISDALKRHGVEDDGIGEILSEIKDKGLFTAKEGSKPVLPPVNSISEYDAEALGGELATSAVYEMPEAGMKPWRQEEQASTIRIISDALKRHGIEDDGIGEILSEVKDKGLFTAKEGRKPVLPPGKNIIEYDAEALGGERATNAVYEMPEAGMKPWRQEEQASIIRIISDALKRQGIEDDGIGEILSEVKDKGLFAAKEGRKPVLPPGKNIIDYDAEALGGERATSAVYEMPEAGMKPWRQEEQASTIRIISDALKRQGIEDDGIGEILSEIKDKGLFAAKEGRKPVLPPGKNIIEYEAEALGVERPTKAVYKMPEAGMKPWRQEDQASTGRASFPVKGDLLSIGGDKNIYVIRASSDTEGNEHAYDRKLPISLVFEKAASAREYDGPMTVSAYGGSAAVNKAGNAPYIDGRLLVNQIANQLSDETGKGFGRIKITLSPQNLGNLAMDIVVRENKVHVVMTAERHDVRQALQGHADQLKSALQQQGLQVHTIDFLLQGGHPGRDGGLGSGNLWWREENRKSENRNERAEKPSPAEIASSANGQKEGQGVEGISVFV